MLDLEIVEPRAMIDVLGELLFPAGGQFDPVAVGHDGRLLPRGEDVPDVIAIHRVNRLRHRSLALEERVFLPVLMSMASR